MCTSASEVACTATYPGTKAQIAKGAQPSWRGPNNVAAFLRCLRLLDLDVREDWPGVHEELFSAKLSQQNLQQRVRCVEWSLYCLFEIWDPGYTKDKLRPFFPPLTPLQSLNLRAALYRGLTALKKDGILSKDATLRKTMLDECKGDKFEGVIRCFAIIVLRKATYQKLERRSAASAGFSDALTAHTKLTAKQRERQLPLVLAHRKVLEGKLIERRKVSENFDERKRHLRDARMRLTEKRKLVLAREEELPNITTEELESISHHVGEAWVGNEQWVETLIHGGPDDVGCTLSERFLHSEMKQNSENPDKGLPDISAKFLLADLNERIAKQQSRLQKWAQFQASLEIPEQRKIAAATIQTTNPLLEFAAHQELQLMQDSINPVPSVVDTELCHTNGMDIVDAMRLELENLKPTATRSRIPCNKHPSYRPDGVLATGGKRDKAQAPVSIWTGSHDILARKDPADTSNGALAKGCNEHYDTKIGSDFPNPSTAEEPEDTTLASRPHGDAQSRSPSHSLSSHQDLAAINAALHTTLHDELSGTTSAPDISQHPVSTRPKKGSTSCGDEQTAPSPSLLLEEDPLVQKTPRTLDDAGLTLASPTTDLRSLPKMPLSPPKPKALGLLERTRKSMALLSPSSESGTTNHRPLNRTRTRRQRQQETSHNHLPPKSQPFPVDPFQIPFNPEPIDPTHNPTPRPTIHDIDQNGAVDQQPRSPPQIPTSRPSTPHDQLFSDQADYASVFKSRPRVAVTPPLSTPRKTYPEIC